MMVHKHKAFEKLCLYKVAKTMVLLVVITALLSVNSKTCKAMLYASPPSIDLKLYENETVEAFIHTNAEGFELSSDLQGVVKVAKQDNGLKIVVEGRFIGNHSVNLTLFKNVNKAFESVKNNTGNTESLDKSVKTIALEALVVPLKISVLKSDKAKVKSCKIALRVSDVLLGVDVEPLIIIHNTGDYDLATRLGLSVYDEDYNLVRQEFTPVVVAKHDVKALRLKVKNNLQRGVYYLEVSSQDCGFTTGKFKVLTGMPKARLLHSELSIQENALVVKALINNSELFVKGKLSFEIISNANNVKFFREEEFVITPRSEQVLTVKIPLKELPADLLRELSSNVYEANMVARFEFENFAQETSVLIPKTVSEQLYTALLKQGNSQGLQQLSVEQQAFEKNQSENIVKSFLEKPFNSFKPCLKKEVCVITAIVLTLIFVFIAKHLKNKPRNRKNRKRRKKNKKRFAIMAMLALISMFSIAFMTSFALQSVKAVATPYNSSPSTFNDEGIALNESKAYDQDPDSFALVITNSSNSLEYYSFDTGSHSNDEDVKQLNVYFDLEVVNISDDNWSIEYSENAGSSWNVLTNNNSNTSRTVLTFYDLTEYTNYDWTWNEIANDLRVRIRVIVNGVEDNASVKIYETWATAIVDDSGPNIQLLSPVDGYNTTNSTVVFEYNVTDNLSSIENCSLLINGVINKTDTSVSEGVVQNFTTSLGDGSFNWSVQCFDDSTAFNSNTSELRTINVDLNPPNVTLVSPANNYVWKQGYNVSFNYTVQDTSPIANCSLFINGSRVETMFNVTRGVVQSFHYVLNNSQYNWSVTCFDVTNKSNSSQVWNLTVDVDLNPVVVNVTVTQNIDLQPGGVVTIYCNGTGFDEDGNFEIVNVTARFFHESSFDNAADSNNTHYTNNSCNYSLQGSYNVTFTCAFNIAFNALPGNWTCNVTIIDLENGSGSNYNVTSVNELYAFNVSPQFIDYGWILPEGVSSEQFVNVYNLGNKEIDIALWGYGSEKQDGYSLVCDYGNVSIDLERYSLSQGLDYYNMHSLTPSPYPLDDFNLQPRNDSFEGFKPVYWRLKLPKPVRGSCNGFVVFSLIAS